MCCWWLILPHTPSQAVLGRKLVVPEVYDLMGQVQALMIRSQATPVRQACSAVRIHLLF